MVAVLAHQQVRQQPGRGQAVIGHAQRRGRNDRRQLAPTHPHIFGPDGFLPEKLARLIIQPPAHLCTDALPLFRLGLHQLRLDDFPDH